MYKDISNIGITKTFKFYTYDPNGKDIVIPIQAMTQDEAWTKFDRIYGSATPVDMVREQG